MLFLLACLGPDDPTPGESAVDSRVDSPADSPSDSSVGEVLWDLEVTGDAYPHIGQTVGMNVIRADTDELVGQAFIVLEDNTIALSFDETLADGVDHIIDWYADNNEDGACNDGDHAWVFELPAVDEDTALVLDHVNGAPFDYDNACSHF